MNEHHEHIRSHECENDEQNEKKIFASRLIQDFCDNIDETVIENFLIEKIFKFILKKHAFYYKSALYMFYTILVLQILNFLLLVLPKMCRV